MVLRRNLLYGGDTWRYKYCIYLLKCKVCGEAFYVTKAKTKFWYRFINYKDKHSALRKGNRKLPQKLFHNCYCLDLHWRVDDWDFTLFEQCEIHKQLKVRNFWQNRLKTFYPSGLHEKKDYLPLAYPIYEIQTIYYKGNYIYADIYR